MENIPDKAKAVELVQTLKERQDIASLCYIPLNCAIVIYVYEKEQCILPRSLTKLYEIFILNAVKRHANITGNDDPSSIRRLHTLEKLPKPLQQQFSALSKLAYNGLVTDKMIFSIDNLQATFLDYRDLDIERSLLGLMTIFKGFTSTGEELSYQFLHLTIQEFLAARWAASQFSADEMLKFFQDHLGEERYRMVLLFLAGISQLKFPSTGCLFQGTLDLNSLSHMKKVGYFFFLFHLIYESQNFSLSSNLGSAIEGRELSVAGYFVSPFNCLVLTHFLAWCECSLKLLDLRACGLTSQSLEIMHRVNLAHRGNTQIEEVDLSYNSTVITKLSLLPKLPMFEHTRKVTVYGLQCPEGVSPEQMELHSLLDMRHLTTLEAEIPESSKVGKSLLIGKFFRSLKHNTSLEKLDLSGNNQLADGDSETVGCVIERMLKVNRTVKVLNLSHFTITDSIVKHILTGLTKNTSLVTLDMGSPKLSGSCALSLFQQMTTHPTLSITVGEVNVLGVGRVMMDSGTMWCVIGDLIPKKCVEFFIPLNNSGLKVSKLIVQDLTDQTAEHFALGLSESQSIQALDLVGNKISSAGAVSIFRSLEHNTSLEELDLSENRQLAEGDGEAVGCAIERMLSVNRTLKVLNLSDCRLDTTAVTHIAAGLAHNASLAELNIGAGVWSRNNITSEGWVHLFKALCNNTSLKKLSISWNKLEIEGSVALTVMLSFNTSLTELNLGRCDIPEAGLTEILKTGMLLNTSLKKLDISHINLGMEGSVALAEMLSCNKSLTELNLKWCDIPEAGLREITRGLLQNTTLQTLTLWPLQQFFFEAEIEKIKKSGNFTPQSSSKLEIKTKLQ